LLKAIFRLVRFQFPKILGIIIYEKRNFSEKKYLLSGKFSLKCLISTKEPPNKLFLNRRQVMIKPQTRLITILTSLILLSIICFTLISFAEERLVLTAYYPAPNAMYKNLTSQYLNVRRLFNLTGDLYSSNHTYIRLLRVGEYDSTKNTPDTTRAIIALSDFSDTGLVINNTNNNINSFLIQAQSTGADRFWVKSDGGVYIGKNLGIGTSPDTDPNILINASSTQREAKTVLSANGTIWQLISSSQNNLPRFMLSYGPVTAGVPVVTVEQGAGQNRVYIDKTGNITIGGRLNINTNNQAQTLLDVNGKVTIRGGKPVVGKFLKATSSSGDADWQYVELPQSRCYYTLLGQCNTQWRGEDTVTCSSGYYVAGMYMWTASNEDNEGYCFKLYCCRSYP